MLRRPVKRALLPLAGLAVVSCKSGDPMDDGQTAGAIPVRADDKRVEPTKAAAAVAPPAEAKPGKPHVEWPAQIPWKTWDQGLSEAKSTNRPILLVVYANWCPHCKELAPVFNDPEVVKLASKMVVVRQDADEEPSWLTSRLGRFGGYVPRVFFLSPTGDVQADITSGNARYPYFYTPEGIEQLRASMRRAVGS